jgi:hypothetical protein
MPSEQFGSLSSKSSSYPACTRATGFFVVLICVALLLPTVLFAKNFVKPVAQPAFNYPAHDLHRDEKVTIAADPYDTAEKAKIFSVNFMEAGFLPVFFIVTNDGDQPISISNMQITLITAHHSKLTPSSPADISRRLSNPQAPTRPSPIPLPRKKVKGAVGAKEMEEIESSQFAAKAVEPHSTQSGFLFFDVGGIAEPLEGANVDITGVTDGKGNELIYFEIPMEKYLNAPPKS